jgi:hypothetical protein
MASELIGKLMAGIARHGDLPVKLDVSWPHEVYEVEPDDPVAFEGATVVTAFLIQAGSEAG